LATTEEQNREFFKAYYLRLMLKNQITAFNKLLEDQLQIMNKEFSSGIPSMSPPDPPNGSSSTNVVLKFSPCRLRVLSILLCDGTLTWLFSLLVSVKQNLCFLPEVAPGSTMPHGIMRNGSSSGIMNGTLSGDQLIYSGKDMHGLHSGIDASSNLQSTQNSAAVLFGVDNGTAVKTESGYSTNADFAFGNTFLESCQSIGDASGGSFSSSELNGQPLNDSLLDIESSSFGFLSPIPQNFIFPDLAEDFNQSAEVLENYNKSPFLASETNNFSDSAGGDHAGNY
ncbi:hypothetical protein EJB05_41053, partial [Eragrostis curvula]